jgi:hypothetical protein
VAVNAAPSSLAGRLTSRRVLRWLPWLSALVLAAGVIAFFVARSADNTAPGSKEHFSKQPVQRVAPPAKKVPLERAARVAAGDFILKAVQRKDAVAAYRLSGPQIRGGETLKQWKRDWNDPNVGVPIVPYTQPLLGAPIKVDASHPREAEIEVALVPKTKAAPNTPEGQAQLFLMILHKYGVGKNARWLVDYWAPRSSNALPTME